MLTASPVVHEPSTFRRLVLEWCGPQPWVNPEEREVALRCRCGSSERVACPTPEICLVYALYTDDPTPYRGGMSRRERAELWGEQVAIAIQRDSWIAMLAR